MNAYDIDGVVTAGHLPSDGDCIISGRTCAEWDANCDALARRWPVYIRGIGAYGDREAAGTFKGRMAAALGINTFYEDDPVQIDLILEHSPGTAVIHVV